MQCPLANRTAADELYTCAIITTSCISILHNNLTQYMVSNLHFTIPNILSVGSTVQSYLPITPERGDGIRELTAS